MRFPEVSVPPLTQVSRDVYSPLQVKRSPWIAIVVISPLCVSLCMFCLKSAAADWGEAEEHFHLNYKMDVRVGFLIIFVFDF